nr:replication initiator protein A [Clostridium kluyveri]
MFRGGISEMEKYKINEANQFKFFQIPKELFINRCYRCKLNSDTKLTYTLLLDRMHLSEKNKWVNHRDEIYLLYTKEDIANILGISVRTVYKAFKVLEECELIYQKRQGLNMPNRIYIGKFRPDFTMTCNICTSEHENHTATNM